MGTLLKMWFKPLQAIFGDMVAYEDANDEENVQQGHFERGIDNELFPSVPIEI